jgi:nucleoside diphosphate kinase
MTRIERASECLGKCGNFFVACLLFALFIIDSPEAVSYVHLLIYSTQPESYLPESLREDFPIHRRGNIFFHKKLSMNLL